MRCKNSDRSNVICCSRYKIINCNDKTNKRVNFSGMQKFWEGSMYQYPHYKISSILKQLYIQTLSLSLLTKSSVSGGLWSWNIADFIKAVNASAPHSRNLLWGCCVTCNKKGKKNIIRSLTIQRVGWINP